MKPWKLSRLVVWSAVIMTSRKKITETDLARTVIHTLKEWRWDVYQEVEGPGGRVDIVAVRGKIQWAIECKVSFGLAVIEQARNWRPFCHYSSVAVPQGISHFGREICKLFGVGALSCTVWPENPADGEVREMLKPVLNRRPVLLKLHEEQKDFCEAGSSRGGHYTDFKRTKAHLISAVRNKPGIEFQELIKALDHHYSSLSTAKSCLRKFIGGHVIPELKTEIVNGKLCVFLSP
jgi:hypothetical protein